MIGFNYLEYDPGYPPLLNVYTIKHTRLLLFAVGVRQGLNFQGEEHITVIKQ